MQNQIKYQVDFLAIVYFVLLVMLGWLNIYAADYDPELNNSIFSLDQSAAKQMLWISASILLIAIVFILDYRFYESFGYIIYFGVIILLVAVLFLGKEVAGSTSWFEIGFIKVQPSEFAKIGAAIGLAKYLSTYDDQRFKKQRLRRSAAFFLLPMALIILQGDLGSAMVYGSLVIVLFREGLSVRLLLFALYILLIFFLTLLLDQWILLVVILAISLIALGLFARATKGFVKIISITLLTFCLVKSVDFVLNDVLKAHQKQRVLSLINPNADPLGIGWNVMQSKIAIGSGGFMGKGFLKGTQTKFDFVPAQTTDFIFCTIGEEHGWLGGTFILIIFGAFFMRLLMIAERQKSAFVRIYGYAVFSIMFFHFAINIAMTIGLFPVIGIPLPFFSY